MFVIKSEGEVGALRPIRGRDGEVNARRTMRGRESEVLAKSKTVQLCSWVHWRHANHATHKHKFKHDV